MIDQSSDASDPIAASGDCSDQDSSARFLTGLRAIHRSYNLPTWIAPFENLASRSRKIQLAMRFFEVVRGTVIGDLLFATFAGLSALRCYMPPSAEGAVFALALYPNERHVVSRFSKTLPKYRTVSGDVSVRNVFALLRDFPRAIPAIVAALIRSRRYLRTLHRTGHFLPVCQTSKYIACYAAYEFIFRTHRPRAVVISTMTHPECWAAVSAAHKHGIRTIFAAHASLPPEGNAVAPHTEFLLLHSRHCVESCVAAGGKVRRKSLWGLEGETLPLRFPDDAEDLVLGLFLTAPVNEDGLLDVVRELIRVNRPKYLLLRPHPIGFLSPNLAHLERDVPGLRLAGRRSLAECIEECEVVLSGNSNVHRDVLRAGVPTLYVAGIDLSGYDYWRFVRGGFVPEADLSQPIDIAALKAFYNDGWRQHFRNYDASFDESPVMTQHRVTEELTAFLEGHRG